MQTKQKRTPSSISCTTTGRSQPRHIQASRESKNALNTSTVQNSITICFMKSVEVSRTTLVNPYINH